jgi:predicted nucleic acid-binding protein
LIRVVDTSAWIEALAGSSAGARVRTELPSAEEWLAPTIVLFELAKWLTRVLGEDRAEDVSAYADTCIVADLDTTIALSAADVSLRHKLATADAIVYATAQAYGADLLTCDSHFQDLPGVHFIPKHDA